MRAIKPRELVLVLLVLLGLRIVSADAATYGPVNEAATIVGDIFVDTTLGADCLAGNYSIAARACTGADGDAYNTFPEALAATAAGDTVLLRTGGANPALVANITVADGTLANPILIKPYNQEAVTVALNSNIYRLGAYTTLAGLTMLDGQFRPHADGSSAFVTLRNNDLDGCGIPNPAGALCSPIMVNNEPVDDLVVDGNILQDGTNDTRSTIHWKNVQSNNLTVTNNRWISGGAPDTAEDGMQLQRGTGTILIANNWFDAHGSENYIDIKPSTNGPVTGVVRNNRFDGADIPQSPLLIRPGTLANVSWTFADNYFSACAPRCINLKFDDPAQPCNDNNTVTVTGNILDNTATPGSTAITVECRATITGNTFIDGTIGVSGGGRNPTGVVIEDNILLDATLTISAGTIASCTNNLLDNTTDSGQCTGNIAGTAALVNVGAQDYNPGPTSDALAGCTGGITCGTLQPPPVVSCEAIDANTIHINYAVAGGFQPAANPDETQIAARQNAGALTETNATILGNTTLVLTVSDTMTAGGGAIDIALAGRASITDSAAIGGPDAGTGGLDSIANLDATPVTCTNSIGGASHILTQAAYRFIQFSDSDENCTTCERPRTGVDNFLDTFAPKRKFVLAINIEATAADPPDQTYGLFCEKNGAGGFVAVTDTCTGGNVCHADHPTITVGDATTVTFDDDGGLANVNGAFNEGGGQTPPVALGQDEEFVNRWALQLDAAAVPGTDSFQCRVETDAGGDLDVYTALATFTVSPGFLTRTGGGRITGGLRIQ